MLENVRPKGEAVSVLVAVINFGHRQTADHLAPAYCLRVMKRATQGDGPWVLPALQIEIPT